jgi:hypothetical protein
LADQVDSSITIRLQDAAAQLVGARPSNGGEITVDLLVGQAGTVVMNLNRLLIRFAHHLDPWRWQLAI